MHVPPTPYSALATAVLFVHALFTVWVVFGALLTRSRPVLRWLHIVSLVWGILTELLPWPCPLTLLENWLEQKGAGRAIPRRIPASLSGQDGLSGYFCHRVDGGWRNRLRLQPRPLWKASVENPASIIQSTGKIVTLSGAVLSVR